MFSNLVQTTFIISALTCAATLRSAESTQQVENNTNSTLAACPPEQTNASYAKCKACHPVGGGQDHGMGPNLHTVFGREMGTAEGFRYSRAMRKGDLIWDEASLDEFLNNPQSIVPGTTMPFAGLKNAEDRSSVIYHLQTIRNAEIDKTNCAP